MSTACAVNATTGAVTLTVKQNEVAFVGWQSATVAVTNAVTTTGEVCTIPATAGVGKAIIVNGQGGTITGPEKLILDSAGGTLDSWPMTVKLDTAPGILSEIEIDAPNGGSNMALGVNGLDMNTLTTRGGDVLDVAISWSNAKIPGQIIFNGGNGVDQFTADVGGIPASSPFPAAVYSGWDAPASILAKVGAAYTGPLTISGGAGNDFLAGGAGTNSISGGAGDDYFPQSTSARAETISGGDGWDTVDYSARSALQPVTVTLGIDGALSSVAVVTGGSGTPAYKKGDVLTVMGTASTTVSGGVTPATVTVTSVNASGVITGVAVGTAGSGYLPAASYDTAGGSGDGTATIEVLANGVATATPVVAGTGYKANDTLTLHATSGGTVVDATITVATVSTAGAILTATVATAGGGTTLATGFSGNNATVYTPTATSGAGINATFSVTTLSSGDDGITGEQDSIGGTAGAGSNDVENVIGGLGNDTLDARTVAGLDVVLQGNLGSDTLRGGTGRDDLCGGPGNDTIFWSGGSAGSGTASSLKGDFISGSGGTNTGAVSTTADLDAMNYTTVGATVTACLDPTEAACNGIQNGAAGETETINNTAFQACPGTRHYLIKQGAASTHIYTPGASTTSSGVLSVALGVTGSATYHVGDLVRIGATASEYAILEIASVTGGPPGTALTANVIQAGSGFTAATFTDSDVVNTGVGGSQSTWAVTLETAGDYAAYNQVPMGSSGWAGAMKNDIAAIDGDLTHINKLYCNNTAGTACTLVGGTAADILVGTTAADAIFGRGGGDTVVTRGGSDLVDLTNTTATAKNNYVACGVTGWTTATDTPTFMFNSADTMAVFDTSSALISLTGASTAGVDYLSTAAMDEMGTVAALNGSTTEPLCSATATCTCHVATFLYE